MGPMRPRIVFLLALSLLVAGCVTSAQTDPLASEAGPTVREFHLEAVEKDIELYPGKWVKAWTYDGQLPGPVIRVTEGDLVRVHFRNDHALPHTIHFHGAHPFGMDGDDSQSVAPGETFTYEFVAGPAGAYVYHCHVDTPVHIPMGLYGQFIVDPKGGWPGGPVDKELFALFSDWNPRHNLTAETYLFNGKAFPSTEPLQVDEGDRVRVFMSSMSDFPVAGHLHGYLPQQVWPAKHPIDVVPLAHAETRVIAFTADNPGAWMFHDHYEQHLKNDGVYPGGGLNAIEVGREYHGKFRERMGADDLIEAHHKKTGGNAAPHAGVASAAALPENTVRVQDYAFSPGTLTVKAGAGVTWKNEGEAPHMVTSVEKGGPLESGMLDPGESWSHTFTEPGTYEYRCLPHAAKGKDGRSTGMVGKVVVT